MRSSELNPNVNHEYLKMFGSAMVVGEYREDGTKVSEPIPTNPEMKGKIDKMFALSAAMGGGELLPKQSPKSSKPIKAKKRAVKARSDNPAPLTPLVTQLELDNETPHDAIEETYDHIQRQVSVKKQPVYLHNKMGKIKMQIEGLLESEMAYCLVFNNDDDVIFTPNPGETLNFTNPNGDTTAVYYADTLFTWTDSVKKLMILFKTKDD